MPSEAGLAHCARCNGLCSALWITKSADIVCHQCGKGKNSEAAARAAKEEKHKAKKKKKAPAARKSKSKRAKAPAAEDAEKTPEQLVQEALAVLRTHATVLLQSAAAEKLPDSKVGPAKLALAAYADEVASMNQDAQAGIKEIVKRHFDEFVARWSKVCKVDARAPIPAGAREALWRLVLDKRIANLPHRYSDDENKAKVEASWKKEKLPFDVKCADWYDRNDGEEADRTRFNGSDNLWVGDNEEDGAVTFGRFCVWKYGLAMAQDYERTVLPLYVKTPFTRDGATYLITDECKCLKTWTGPLVAGNFEMHVIGLALRYRLDWDEGDSGLLPCPAITEESFKENLVSHSEKTAEYNR